MIFNGGNTDRLNYFVAKVLELDEFLIINGETYDKKTLFKISDSLVEYGLGYGNGFFRKMFQTKWFSSPIMGGLKSGNTSFITNYLRDRNKLGGALSVYDNQNPNIIHIIAGETCIKLNTLTMKYTIARNTKNTFSVLNCIFLHQNDDYIYFMSQYIGNSDKLSNGCHYVMVYDKNLMEFTYKTQFGTINTPYSLNLIHKMDNKVYLSACVGGVFYLHNIQCDSDTPKVTTLTPLKVVAALKVATLNVVPSEADKNGIFYKLTNLYNLSFEKILDGALVDSGLDTMFSSNSSLKVDDCLKAKYSLDSIDEAGRKSYMPMVTGNTGVSSGAGGRLWECMLVDDGKYLVIQHTTCNSLINPSVNDWIAIFKRNDENNPLDLTMTDYLPFSELNRSEQFCRHFCKVNENLLSAVGTNIVLQLKIVDGKFVENHLNIQNIYGFGYDSEGRYYFTTSSSDFLEIDSDSSASKIELDYVNSVDAFVEIKDGIVKRDVVVSTKNANGELVKAHFELYSTSAKFSNNSLTIRGQTNEKGKATIPITFSGVFDSMITGRIIHENEL